MGMYVYEKHSTDRAWYYLWIQTSMGLGMCPLWIREDYYSLFK